MKPVSLFIANTLINQDADGRYCLNDLHKAAGGESKHQPANFLRLDSTKALIEEINQSSDLRSALEVINGGQNPGTFGCKEIIYAYGMWISAEFYLHVIRAYDALVMGPPPHSHSELLFEIDSLKDELLALYRERHHEKAASQNSVAVSGGHRPWTAAQDQELLALRASGLGWTAIGVKVGRSRENCRYRYNKLMAQQGGAE